MFITVQLMFIRFSMTLPKINNCRWLSPNVGPVEQLNEKTNLLNWPKIIKTHYENVNDSFIQNLMINLKIVYWKLLRNI